GRTNRRQSRRSYCGRHNAKGGKRMAGKDDKDKAGAKPGHPFPTGAFGKPPPIFRNLQDTDTAKSAEPPRADAGEAKGADAPSSPFSHLAAKAPELQATLRDRGK